MAPRKRISKAARIGGLSLALVLRRWSGLRRLPICGQLGPVGLTAQSNAMIRRFRQRSNSSRYLRLLTALDPLGGLRPVRTMPRPA